jgi:ATP-dependent Clp protease ATP-binding subunit ClpA
MNVTDAAKEVLAQRGFDSNLGARPLRRVIQKLVLDALALKIVSGDLKEGDNALVDAQNSEIAITLPVKNVKPRKTAKTAA